MFESDVTRGPMARATLALAALALAALALLGAPRAQAGAVPASAPAAPPPPTASAPVPAAAPTRLAGPLVAGVCLLSQEGLITGSKLGQAAAAHLQELGQKSQAELVAEQTRLQARGKALEAKRATLTPLQLEAQGKALNERAQALQAEAGERRSQLEAAKSKALSGVIEHAQPFIAQAYAAHGCGLLLAREAALAGNFGNDLTPEVIAALDAPPPPAAAAPTAAAPSAPPAPPKP
jgi:Skp family chaperone for outer membrane proteins